MWMAMVLNSWNSSDHNNKLGHQTQLSCVLVKTPHQVVSALKESKDTSGYLADYH